MEICYRSLETYLILIDLEKYKIELTLLTPLIMLLPHGVAVATSLLLMA